MTELAANVNEESMYAKCDAKRNESLWLEALIDHRKNGSALSVEDQNVFVKGWETLKNSLADEDIFCKWKDGSTSCEKLSNLKELHPLHIIKYSITQGIQNKPASNWWVHHDLKKRDQIIFMVR